MIFLFAFHWESELGYTLGTRLGKWDCELFWGNFTSAFCCWRCQSHQWGLSGLCWEHWLLRSRAAGTADPWGIFPPGTGHMRGWSIQSCRAAGLSLLGAKAIMIISVPFCALRAVRELGVKMGHLWHPMDSGRGMQTALQLWISSRNRPQIALNSPISIEGMVEFQEKHRHVLVAWVCTKAAQEYLYWLRAEQEKLSWAKGSSEGPAQHTGDGGTACPSSQLPQLHRAPHSPAEGKSYRGKLSIANRSLPQSYNPHKYNSFTLSVSMEWKIPLLSTKTDQ